MLVKDREKKPFYAIARDQYELLINGVLPQTNLGFLTLFFFILAKKALIMITGSNIKERLPNEI